MNHTLLSVVIPTWNRVDLICDAIDSVLLQDEKSTRKGGAIEVIVVDDGSTDDTRRVLTQRYGRAIKLLCQPQRGGAGAARNAGVATARGELLAFLDSDDLWLAGKLDAELKVLEDFPDAGAIISDSLSFIDDVPNEYSRFEPNGLLDACRGQVRWNDQCPWIWTKPENAVATCSITLRRSAVARLGEPLFAEDLVSCEDWELEVRMYQLCRVVVLPEVFSHIRCIDDSPRIGRAAPGNPRSKAQNISLLRDRLTVMNRSFMREKLGVELLAQLDRCTHHIERELAGYEALV